MNNISLKLPEQKAHCVEMPASQPQYAFLDSTIPYSHFKNNSLNMYENLKLFYYEVITVREYNLWNLVDFWLVLEEGSFFDLF